MTREQLRLLFIEHRSRRAVAQALNWSEWETRRVFSIHRIKGDWKDELTNAEIRAAWIHARGAVSPMAADLHIAPRTARELLERINVTPPRRGQWQRREQKGRKRGKKRSRASSRTGLLARTLLWPSLNEWRSPLLEVYYPVAVGQTQF